MMRKTLFQVPVVPEDLPILISLDYYLWFRFNFKTHYALSYAFCLRRALPIFNLKRELFWFGLRTLGTYYCVCPTLKKPETVVQEGYYKTGSPRITESVELCVEHRANNFCSFKQKDAVCTPPEAAYSIYWRGLCLKRSP